jgi:hypothetical protein
LDKKSGRLERLQPVEGSSLYAADVAGMALISTSVESSPVNASRQCSLYGSRDDGTWTRLASFEKDVWTPLLQFGLIVLPTVQSPPTTPWMFSGQALVGQHDRVSICGHQTAEFQLV